MKIKDLPLPVVAAKTAWIKSTQWEGFTPISNAPEAIPRHQVTIDRQARGGYVLEYITEILPKPNAGYEEHPDYLQLKAEHAIFQGRLTGVHRLWRTNRSLSYFMGEEAFQLLQRTWMRANGRNLWTAVFLIVERYKILGDPLPPRARKVFPEDIYQRLIMHPSSTLRPMVEAEREMIADLDIVQDFPDGSILATQEDAERVPDKTISPRLLRMVGQDLAGAWEGLSQVEKIAGRKRAAHIANRFAYLRQEAGTLTCDDCGFDPLSRLAGTGIRPRSLMEVHHKIPLMTGPRFSFSNEFHFELLCPNCHRLEHLRLALPPLSP